MKERCSSRVEVSNLCRPLMFFNPKLVQPCLYGAKVFSRVRPVTCEGHSSSSRHVHMKQRCSVGLKSGTCVGHSTSATPNWSNQAFIKQTCSVGLRSGLCAGHPCSSNSSVLHRTLTSTLLNTLGITQKTDRDPGLLFQPQYLTSQMCFWLNVHKCPRPASKILWKAVLE